MLITTGNQTLTATDAASGISGSATFTVGLPPGGGARRSAISGIGSTQGAPITPELTSVDRLFASLQEGGLLWARRKHDGAAAELFDGEGGMLV
jgi:hypothetical protein